MSVLAVAATIAACGGDDSVALGPIGDAMYAKGPGGSTTPNADVTITGAVTTPSPQPVTVGSGNPLQVRSAPQWSTWIATVFPNRMSLGPAGCVVDPSNAPSTRVNDLFSRLAEGAAQRQMNAVIDLTKVGQPSSSHSFFTHTEGDLHITRAVGTFELLSNASPTVRDSSGSYIYSGGSLKISDRTGGASKHLHIVCPNVDELTVTVVPR